MASEEFVLKYPFCQGARKLLEKSGLETVSNKSIEMAGEFARRLIVASAVELNTELPYRSPSKGAVVNYALARLLLACVGDDFVTKKFARNLARVSVLRLRQDKSEFETISREFFPSLRIESGSFDYSVSLFDFLKTDLDLVCAPLQSSRVFLHSGLQEGLLHDYALEKALSQSVYLKVFDLSVINPSSAPKIVQEYASEFAESLPRRAFPRVSNLSGLMDANCIKALVKSGAPEGKRFYGSMALAIACLKGGLSKGDAENFLREYSLKSSKNAAHEFSVRESAASVDWVYRHPSIGFSCARARSQGLAGNSDELCLGCVLQSGRKTR
ncbi:MAG: hypothetical protein ACE5DI_01845 [Candidatus Micrarchaeia archaeon]